MASFQGGLRSHFSRNVRSSTSHIEGLVTLVQVGFPCSFGAKSVLSSVCQILLMSSFQHNGCLFFKQLRDHPIPVVILQPLMFIVELLHQCEITESSGNMFYTDGSRISGQHHVPVSVISSLDIWYIQGEYPLIMYAHCLAIFLNHQHPSTVSTS